MAKVDVYYDIRVRVPHVHHNNNACAQGKAIESHARSSGADNRPLCEECGKLSA